ncbi:MAG: ABC transporter permease [Anaerolineales bacterium]
MTPKAIPARGRMARLLSAGRRLRPQSASEIYGAAVLFVISLIVLAAPLIARNDPLAQDISRQLLPPGSEFLLGTDQFGRDVFARVLYGGRVSIGISISVVVLAGMVGIAVGSIAGFAGGWVDELLMRIAEIFLAFPAILLALVVAGALGPSLRTTAVAIAVAWWAIYARVIRGEILSVREREYVVAARTIGVRSSQILLRTVIPNSLGALKLVMILDIGYAMIAAATLSFLGLGVKPPSPEWGLMIRESLERPSAWWLFVGPGVAIMLFVSSINFAGSVFTRNPEGSR